MKGLTLLSLICLFIIIGDYPCFPEDAGTNKEKTGDNVIQDLNLDNGGSDKNQGTQIIEEKKPVTEVKKSENIDNGYIKVVNIYKEDYYIKVVFKASYKLNKAAKEKARICIDYYDNKGKPIGGDSEIFDEYKTLVPEETRVIYFNIPPEAKKYRVWLPDFK